MADAKLKIEILKFASRDGAYHRLPSVFRNFIGNTPSDKFKPQAGRYHLYVSFACPWAHRTLIARKLKGLSDIIDVSVVHWLMDERGWRFLTAEEQKKLEGPGDLKYGTVDHVYGVERIKDLYFKANPDYEGRFTVPVLWDKHEQTIVNNESSEILRIFNTGFNSILPSEYGAVDIYPEDLQKDIDEINSWIYDNINNGVYKSGFATSQEVYDKEVVNVFENLDRVEAILKQNHEVGKQFLLGNQLTEADIRLYTTIVRFDCVYHQHFKCNIRMVRHDYPHLHYWLRLLYWKIPGFKETTDFDHIKFHYTKSHIAINPNRITPVGPIPNIMPLGADEKL
ncbi:S-glutathionyl-(chloro)hydroquinone reductase [Scheffersomyces spartinae]|uniref:Glutathione S-transferase omega-like 2 n=1 Tax=Scheffersomyces spartinae TaxID=45513 RepID=A0A9P7V6H2_9ASCO|nr:S-glutathionyl-(chloro)hydroquinone reductase [Scheffersomyces spartinae]KAG7192260.1 S-glutathionyl-(chloro)hydroquinone reductase [Scheffersomyces spartinae]